MQFNSFAFFFFLSIVYLFYLLLRHKGQNRMLLLASYFFYGCWDWRFLSLIFISTITDYFCGIQIDKRDEKKDRMRFVLLSLCINLGILSFFKYFNFFIDNFATLISLFGISSHIKTLHIILPVGISFYTFQTMSYTIDVYRKQITPCRNFFDYALYVSFFPQLVAGPIERGKRLLPQILNSRRIDSNKISEGLLLIYWGLFKKLFVADNLGLIVDKLFLGNGVSSGGEILVGIYAFAFQLYCDFSGYSDIARGVAKLMGFDIMLNFRMPYFATNIQDFWRRWHISLSTWLRDYLYIPLGGNRHGHVFTVGNLLITMIIGGLWHGAAWTFFLWGVYHGIMIAIYAMLKPKIRLYFKPKKGFKKVLLKVVSVVFVFHIFAVGGLLFRSHSLTQAISMLYNLFANFEVTSSVIELFGKYLLYTTPLLIVEGLQLKHEDLTYIFQYPRIIRYSFYSIIFYLLAAHSAHTSSFIYFRF